MNDTFDGKTLPEEIVTSLARREFRRAVTAHEVDSISRRDGGSL